MQPRDEDDDQAIAGMPGPDAAWRPVVDQVPGRVDDEAAHGDLAREIEAVVTALAEALHARLAQGGPPEARTQAYAEHALLRAYLAHAAPDRGHEAVAMDCLDGAIEALAKASPGAALHGGLAGIAWIAEHVQTLLGTPPPSDDDDGNAAVDAALLRALETTPWPRGHDLIGGLAGFGVYALERVPRPSGVALLERVVACLDDLAEDAPTEGRCFRIPPERLPPPMRARFPHGSLDLGVAHGAPGVIALLGHACVTDALAAHTRERARALAGDLWRWVSSQRLPADRDGCFPSRVAAAAPADRADQADGRPGAETGNAGAEAPRAPRSAWCYGDPGVAVALLQAARRLGQTTGTELEAAALAAARKAAARPFAATRVEDAGLCHGAAGLAHLFQRLFQATGEARFGEAARSWIARILDMRRPEGGIAGYLTWGPDRATGSAEPVWHADGSLLTGATGIALALLAAVAPQEPAWDRLFLASA